MIRSQRNLDQLETLSKKLKAKTLRAEAPSQSIAATRLLAREGINAEQLARDLKSFELKTSFEDVFPVEATSLEEYLQQVHEMTMISAIQEAQKDNVKSFNDYMLKVLEDDWRKEKRDFLQSLNRISSLPRTNMTPAASGGSPVPQMVSTASSPQVSSGPSGMEIVIATNKPLLEKKTAAYGEVMKNLNSSRERGLPFKTMLASIKMEVMTPSVDSPDEGNIAAEYYMTPICSPIARPGRPAEVAPVISKHLSDTLLSSGMIDLKELSIISGKAAWMAYLDIYSLDADGALFDAALLSAVAAFSHLNIPAVSLNDDGKVIIISEELNDEEKVDKELVNRDRRKLTITNIPFSLTCILHKNYILSDPTGEEESIMETSLTVVMNTSDQLISLYKPGGPVLACSSSIPECVSLTRQRIKELWDILSDSIASTNVD